MVYTSRDVRSRDINVSANFSGENVTLFFHPNLVREKLVSRSRNVNLLVKFRGKTKYPYSSRDLMSRDINFLAIFSVELVYISYGARSHDVN